MLLHLNCLQLSRYGRHLRLQRIEPAAMDGRAPYPQPHNPQVKRKTKVSSMF